MRSGYVTGSDGVKQGRLCGEFSPTNQGGMTEWIAFATIKTSGYEQWLGDQARRYCSDSSTTWDTKDLSENLLSRLGSPR